MTTTIAMAKAKELLEDEGYVVLKEKSYHSARERQRVAEARLECAIKDAEHCEQWAYNCLAEERRMRERVTFLYGAAIAAGATAEELRGPVANEQVMRRAPQLSVLEP